MLVIVGLIVLLAAVIIGVTGVLTNAGSAHLLTDHFAVLGYHVTGSTGTVFLYGIVVGAVAGIGLAVLLAGAHRAVGRGRDARRELKRFQPDTVPSRPDTKSGTHGAPTPVVHGTAAPAATASTNPDDAATRRVRLPFFRNRSARDHTTSVNDTVTH
jgi:hypothetical protein